MRNFQALFAYLVDFGTKDLKIAYLKRFTCRPHNRLRYKPLSPQALVAAPMGKMVVRTMVVGMMAVKKDQRRSRLMVSCQLRLATRVLPS